MSREQHTVEGGNEVWIPECVKHEHLTRLGKSHLQNLKAQPHVSKMATGKRSSLILPASGSFHAMVDIRINLLGANLDGTN